MIQRGLPEGGGPPPDDSSARTSPTRGASALLHAISPPSVPAAMTSFEFFICVLPYRGTHRPARAVHESSLLHDLRAASSKGKHVSGVRACPTIAAMLRFLRTLTPDPSPKGRGGLPCHLPFKQKQRRCRKFRQRRRVQYFRQT